MGNFTSSEVVTDLRWTPVLRDAYDINTWACPGPGCARGLGWVVNGDPQTYHYTLKRDQEAMLSTMQELPARSRDNENYWPAHYQPWEMREVEHWLCEFDKYNRGLAGEKLKRRFV
jgi:hypothetical protein